MPTIKKALLKVVNINYLIDADKLAASTVDNLTIYCPSCKGELKWHAANDKCLKKPHVAYFRHKGKSCKIHPSNNTTSKYKYFPRNLFPHLGLEYSYIALGMAWKCKATCVKGK